MAFRKFRESRSHRKLWTITVLAFCFIFAFYFYCRIENLHKHLLHYMGIVITYESDLKILDEMGSRDAVLMVKPDQVTTYLQPKAPHLLLKDGSMPEIVIMVTSMVDIESEYRRSLIRQTWKQWSDKFQVRTLFFIALPKYSNKNVIQKLEEENKVHGDIIVDDFKDGYYRLTAKVLRMMKWFLFEYACRKTIPTYFIKADHDVFVNIPNLVSHLHTLHKTKPSNKNLSHVEIQIEDKHFYYVGGERFKFAPIQTDRNNKFYLSPDFWNLEIGYYPTYVPGPFYVLSSKAAEAIYKESFSVPLFPFEDVYLTGMVASDKLNMKISNIPTISTIDHLIHDILKNETKTKESIALHPVKSFKLMSTIYLKVINSTILKG